MIDHTGINVSDYARTRDFYAAALEPLGFTFGMEPMPGIGGFVETVVIEGFGSAPKPSFWITDQRKPVTPALLRRLRPRPRRQQRRGGVPQPGGGVAPAA
jgi:catechol 2,3-dioxygenase-like lactoylglutathione lyase family enzyme